LRFPACYRSWRYRMTIECIIVTSILELLLDFSTYAKLHVRRHGHIARIEEGMNVATHKQAIFRLMRSPFRIWPDMCCFERGQRSLPGNCALPFVGVGHHETKRALAKSWQNQYGRPVPNSIGSRLKERF